MGMKKMFAATFLVALAVFSMTTGAIARESTGCNTGTGNGTGRGVGGTDCLGYLGFDAGGQSSNNLGYDGTGGHYSTGGGCGSANTPTGVKGSC